MTSTKRTGVFRMKESKSDERAQRQLTVQAIAEKLSVHCNKIIAFVNGFENEQVDKKRFNLADTFYTTDFKIMTKAINQLVETYEALRRDVREFAQIGYGVFEDYFPELNMNFETYYSVAASLLNLEFQMRLMRLYCYRLLT
ncbi:MAG: hypothetical protein ACFFCD_17240, partial [Promethearchaeota archaeon]